MEDHAVLIRISLMKKRRRRLKLTQSDVASMAGLSINTVGRIERQPLSCTLRAILLYVTTLEDMHEDQRASA